jgi:glucose-6-phosphate isomerase
MALQAINPTHTAAWAKLQSHYDFMQQQSIRTLFAEQPDRAHTFHIQWEDFLVDYSKNAITRETLQYLLELADAVQLKEAITAYFEGDLINQTEQRAVLHMALRNPASASVMVEGQNVMPEIYVVKQRIKTFANAIISGTHKGYTGKSITDVVNIGIGGSDLGPAMVVEALQFYKNHLNVHFVSNVDGDHVQEVLKKVNPKRPCLSLFPKRLPHKKPLPIRKPFAIGFYNRPSLLT